MTKCEEARDQTRKSSANDLIGDVNTQSGPTNGEELYFSMRRSSILIGLTAATIGMIFAKTG
jgi:hypothetical protein